MTTKKLQMHIAVRSMHSTGWWVRILVQNHSDEVSLFSVSLPTLPRRWMARELAEELAFLYSDLGMYEVTLDLSGKRI